MKRFLLLLWTLWPGAALASDPGTSSAQFLRLGASPRGIGMGEAQVGLADDVYATYWNPAGLARLQSREAGFVHAELALDMRSDYVAYAHPSARWGTLAGSLTHLGTGSFEAFDAVGEATGEVSASDTALALSYARTLFSNRRMGSELSLGGTAKWIEERLDSISAHALAIDIGLLYSPGRRHSQTFEGLTLGLALKNMGSSLKFDQESFPLPRALVGGLSWTGVWLGEKLTLTLDGEQPQAGKTSTGAGLETFLFALADSTGWLHLSRGRGDRLAPWRGHKISHPASGLCLCRRGGPWANPQGRTDPPFWYHAS